MGDKRRIIILIFLNGETHYGDKKPMSTLPSALLLSLCVSVILGKRLIQHHGQHHSFFCFHNTPFSLAAGVSCSHFRTNKRYTPNFLFNPCVVFLSTRKLSVFLGQNLKYKLFFCLFDNVVAFPDVFEAFPDVFVTFLNFFCHYFQSFC